jgi:DNA repair exonuclease SbcCD ATPase subunit
MKFKKMTAENTYSWKKLSFSFTTHRGITLFLGKSKDDNTANGAGKSGIIRTLFLGLWGRELYAEPMDLVIHRSADNGFLIDIEFEDRGHQFRIVRFRKRTDREVPTGVDFYIDGKLFNGDTATKTQEIIDSKLKLSAQLFLSSIMTIQNAKNPFLTATDNEKKEIFSELLDLIVYSMAFDHTKKEIDDLEERFKTLNIKIEQLTEKVKEREEEVNDLKQKESDFENEKTLSVLLLNGKENKIKEEIEELNNSNTELTKINEEITAKNNEIDALKKTKTDAAEQLAEQPVIEEMISEHKEELNQISNSENSLKAQLRMVSSELETLRKRVDKPTVLEKSVDQLRTNSDAVNLIVSEITLHQEKVQNLNQSAKTVSAQFNMANLDRIKELEEKKKEYDKQIEETIVKRPEISEAKNLLEVELKVVKDLGTAIGKIDGKVDLINASLKKLQERKNLLSNVEVLIQSKNDVLNDLAKQVTAAKEVKNTYKDLIVSVNKKIEEVKANLATNQQLAATVEEDLQYLYFWKGGFSPVGIRSFIFDEVIDLLNQKVQANLNDLSNGALSVVFGSESVSSKGTLNNKISTNIYQSGESTTFGLLSGGEQRRAILAVNLALTELAEAYSGTTMNIKFLDEPFDGMDSQGQTECFKIFARLSQNKDGFYIISHDQSFQELCPNVVYIVKENGESKIVTRNEFEPALEEGDIGQYLSFSQD